MKQLKEVFIDDNAIIKNLNLLYNTDFVEILGTLTDDEINLIDDYLVFMYGDKFIYPKISDMITDENFINKICYWIKNKYFSQWKILKNELEKDFNTSENINLKINETELNTSKGTNSTNSTNDSLIYGFDSTEGKKDASNTEVNENSDNSENNRTYERIESGKNSSIDELENRKNYINFNRQNNLIECILNDIALTICYTIY